MNATNGMLCWTPGTDRVKVVPWPDTGGLSDGYSMTALACWSYMRRGLSFEKRKAIVFCEAVHLMVRDNVPPAAVHEALLALDEYRDGLADDMPTENRYER